ncbi:MAG: hypothetical protein R3F37_23860, partial [Candidatus Competibacteraceae bacterium]
MAKKTRTSDQTPSRARKTPVKRTTRTASKTERENTLDTQATQQFPQEPVAKPLPEVNPVKQGTPPTSGKSSAPTPKPVDSAAAQSDQPDSPDVSLSSAAQPRVPTPAIPITETWQREPKLPQAATAPAATDTATPATQPEATAPTAQTEPVSPPIA